MLIVKSKKIGDTVIGLNFNKGEFPPTHSPRQRTVAHLRAVPSFEYDSYVAGTGLEPATLRL
jgi:hypothetical protein